MTDDRRGHRRPPTEPRRTPGMPACSACSGSSMRTRTRITRFGRSRAAEQVARRELGAADTTRSTRPRTARGGSPSTRSRIGAPSTTFAMLGCGHEHVGVGVIDVADRRRPACRTPRASPVLTWSSRTSPPPGARTTKRPSRASSSFSAAAGLDDSRLRLRESPAGARPSRAPRASRRAPGAATSGRAAAAWRNRAPPSWSGPSANSFWLRSASLSRERLVGPRSMRLGGGGGDPRAARARLDECQLRARGLGVRGLGLALQPLERIVERREHSSPPFTEGRRASPRLARILPASSNATCAVSYSPTPWYPEGACRCRRSHRPRPRGRSRGGYLSYV